MITSLSVFSGCLGLDLGLEMAGLKTIAYVDKDENCHSTIVKNRPKAIVLNNIFDKNVCRYKNVDIIVGGPPCQSFSTIGKRKFLNCPDGLTMLGFVNIIKNIKPKMFLMENVQGIISADKGAILKQLIEQFSQMGYNIDWGVLNSSDFQVPQIRKRFIMIGNKGKKIELSKATSSKRIILLKEAIGDLENKSGACATFSPLMADFMKKIPEGGNWKSLTPKEQDNAMGAANRKSGGLTAFYRRLSYDRQSPTLVASPTHRGTTLCHPRKNRPLSVAEYKRIQGFPDDWIIAGSVMNQYRQLGNAVPVLMGKALGKLIKDSM